MEQILHSIQAQTSASALAQQGSRISGWVWVVIFIIVTLIVWWLLTRSTTEEPGIHVSHEESHAEAHEVETVEIAEKIAPIAVEPAVEEPPAPVLPPEPGKPDDLTLLEGIGPKVNALLQAAGIHTFVQLAVTETDQIKKILEGAGYAYMDPASWPQQAHLLAEGRMEEFDALTASLKGGRKIA